MTEGCRSTPEALGTPPPGPFPQGVHPPPPPGSYPSAPYLSGQYPPGQYPTGQYPPGQYPPFGYGTAGHGVLPYRVPPRRPGAGVAAAVVLCLVLIAAMGTAGMVFLISFSGPGRALTGTGHPGTVREVPGGKGGTGGEDEEDLTPERRFDQDVRIALEARTSALRGRNEKAFLASVDSTDPALVARQRQTFRNLVQFSLAEPVYRDVEDGGTASSAVAGGREFGVALVHRLGKADVEPVALGYEETWVRRGGAVMLAKSVPGRGLARSRSPGPIDGIALKVAGGGLVTVAAGPDVPMPTVTKVDKIAEKAAVTVRRLWGARPGPQGFVVFLTRSKTAKQSWYGGTTVAASSGFCASLYAAETAATREVPLRLGGARIVIDMAKTRGNADLALTLRHEFTHAQTIAVQAVRTSADQAYPVWAEEGFAAWSEEREVPLARNQRLLDLRYLAQRGQFRTGLPPGRPRDFYSSREETIGLNYAMSAMVFRYIAERWGSAQAIAYYTWIASGRSGPAQAVLGISSQEFEKAWTAWLVKQVRSGR